VTTYISWPNYHSGANGDWQTIAVEGEVHPLLRDPTGGDARPPPGPSARRRGFGARRTVLTLASSPPVAARSPTGRSTLPSPSRANPGGEGRGLAQSTFHHFADYNWDPRLGSPSFVTEAPGDSILRDPESLRQTQAYMANLAGWLSR
jgi:hypothetical protein